jgi:hypothetical protein
MTIDALKARRAALWAIPPAQLTDAQRAERDNLDYRWDLRMRRLYPRIARLRAQLAELEAMAA